MYVLISTLIMIAVATGLVLVFFGLNRLLGPSTQNEIKTTPFETGRAPAALVGHRMSVKFYMIAILFVIFDVEMIFFYPWAVVFRDLGAPGLISMILFIGVLVLGLAYVWKKGALEWE